MSEKQYHLIGWLLFLICSLFYTASSYAAGDRIGFVGGLLFFGGCVAFMIPLIKPQVERSIDHQEE